MLFLSMGLLLIGCKPDNTIYDVEYIYNGGDTGHDQGNNGGDDSPPAETVNLVLNGDILYNSSEVYLDLANVEIHIPDGMLLERVAIKLFENGNELVPTDYWQFEKRNNNSFIWFRPFPIQLDPNRPIIGNSISIKIFGYRGSGTGPELLHQENDVPIRRL